MATKRRVPGWLVMTGWVVLGVAAVGLPVALVVAGLDWVRREGDVLSQGLVLGALILLAVALVVGLERGLAYAAKEWSIGSAAGIAAGVAVLVLVGVLLPTVGLVLVAVGVVVGLPALVAGIGYLAYWRWQHGPRPPARVAPLPIEVRAAAERRRILVRARHDRTREAVAKGLIGPGFTQGR